jgi:hypothetical protein
MSSTHFTVAPSTKQSRPIRFIKTTRGYKSVPGPRPTRRLRPLNPGLSTNTPTARMRGLADLARAAGEDVSGRTIQVKWRRIADRSGRRQREVSHDAN